MNKKKIIFDIGAYDGMNGLVLAIKNPHAHVHAFEANKYQIKYINKN